MAQTIKKIVKTYLGIGKFEIRIMLNINNGYFYAEVPAKSLNPGNLKIQSKSQLLIDTIRVSAETYKGLLVIFGHLNGIMNYIVLI